LAMTASTAAALNPQPLPPIIAPTHVIPRCVPVWDCS
jgi:hypothetical protein